MKLFNLLQIKSSSEIENIKITNEFIKHANNLINDNIAYKCNDIKQNEYIKSLEKDNIEKQKYIEVLEKQNEEKEKVIKEFNKNKKNFFNI